jgi:AraC-like DNA-binding protein
MIDILRFDLMVRAGTLSLLALLMAILVRDHRRTLPGRLAVLMIIGVACHVIAEIPETVPLNSPSDLIVSVGEASQFGTFWLFCRAWFNDEARIGWRSILIVLFAMALSLTNMWLWQELKHGYWPTDLAMRLVWLGLTSAGLWIAWKGRNNDLIEARRRLRIWFVGTIGVSVLSITLIYLFFNQIIGEKAPLSIELVIGAFILIVTGALCFALFDLRQQDLFAEIKTAVPPSERIDDPANIALVDRLHDHMAVERAYRDEKLTIAGLAAQLGEQEYRLRRVINGHLGHRNFAAFLNGYRLDEVRHALTDAEQTDVPIITIALDAGFGSLAPFNRAFREAEAMTPSAYRQRATVHPQDDPFRK